MSYPVRKNTGDPISPAVFACGIQPMIETLAADPDLQQIWYLDDGLIFGSPDAVGRALLKFTELLKQLDLEVNSAKCELYANCELPFWSPLSAVPRVEVFDQWTYLGSPTDKSVESKVARSAEVCGKISNPSKSYPSQSLRLLRLTAGSCRAEFLLQAMGPSSITSGLAAKVCEHLRAAFQRILQTEVTDTAWVQATLPLKLGGLGLRDPRVATPD